MSLPADFVASATALECYEACPRRFRQRYIEHVPAAGPDPTTVEQMQRGTLFHRLVLWDDLGLDCGMILDSEGDPDLDAQWAAYRTFRAALPDDVLILHDQVLSAPCNGIPVQARLDALAIWPDGDVTIFDWKTSGRPNRSRLQASPQSKVYPFVVWNALSIRDDRSIHNPEQLRLVYWFPQEPANPLPVPCTAHLLESATAWLQGALDTISADTCFDMTPDRVMCATCEYLAHCGVQAEQGGAWDFDEDYYYLPDMDGDSTFDNVWLH